MPHSRLSLILIGLIFVTSCKPSLDQKNVTPSKETPTAVTRNTTANPTLHIVGLSGYRNVRFGMTEEEAIKAFPDSLSKAEHYSDEYKDCYYLHPVASDDRKESSIAFMMYFGTVQRIDIGSAKIATKAGAKIGMSADMVENLYSNVVRKPNFYSSPIEDLFVSLDEETKIIFEQDTSGKIYSFRIGKSPAVEFPEGCF